MKKPWAKNVVTVLQPEVIVQVQDLQNSSSLLTAGGGGETVYTMGRYVNVLARLLFERKQLGKIDTR